MSIGPDDYFRYSWHGVRVLFPEFEWSEMLYSTNLVGEFFSADVGVDDKHAFYKPVASGTRKYLPYLNLHMLRHKKVG